jgi:methyltransferase (TIGR00027 family)
MTEQRPGDTPRARTDDDTWDITESVGATALGVAAARASETESERPLFHDPFARVFLDAVGQGMWTMFDRSSLATELGADPDLAARMQRLVDFFVTRTAFIDDFFMSAADAGLRQVVILAAGLDARSWRLPWPHGTLVYELDQPKVLEFKSSTLREHGAQPTAQRIDVPVDLRQDWPTALRQSGFDPAAPTAWSAEGLLRYLPAQAQDLLFERIHAISCVGSRIVVNAPTNEALDPGRLARERELIDRVRAMAAGHAGAAPPNIDELWYAEERTDVAEWLGDHGWEASTATVAEVAAGYGRGSAGAGDDSAVPGVLISARRVH